jgi:hypothetical protein
VTSSSGPEGPPRPFGAEPHAGPRPPRTSVALEAAQNGRLLDGPFPRGGLLRGISEGSLLLARGPEVREAAVARVRETGASVLRIPVDWREVAVAEPAPGFEPRDPGSPDYRFAGIDAAVRAAVSAGLTPLLVVSHAPAWAEAPGRWPYAYPGSWAPSPTALEAFAAALASRYDGSFSDPIAPGHALPAVRALQAWNEPNLARYLEPQWVAENGRWSAFSPLGYRQLLNGFYAGVKSVAPGDLVVSAGLAPTGDPEGVGRMAPLRFLRALLCLSPRGAREGCPDPAHFDALAFHPLSVENPDRPAESSLDLSISDAGKVTSALALAEREHTVLPAGAKPLWVTELNWESAPQAPRGVPPALQASWISRALHRLWTAGISLVAWQFLIDPYPAARAGTPTGGLIEYQRPAGLFSAAAGGDPLTARPKAFLRGFRFPFDPLRVDARRVRVWALPGGARRTVELQRETAGRSWLTIGRLRSAPDGVLNVLLRLRGPLTLRLRSATDTSAPASVGRAPWR